MIQHPPLHLCISRWTLDKPKTRCVVLDGNSADTRLLLLREDLTGSVPSGQLCSWMIMSTVLCVRGGRVQPRS